MCRYIHTERESITEAIGLAELRTIAVRLSGWNRKRRRSRRKVKKVKESFINFFNKMVFPVRRLWIAISARVKAPKSGLLKLHNDVQSCGYEDVQVMWEMLRRSESTELNNGHQSQNQTHHNHNHNHNLNHNHNHKRKIGSFWRVFVWSTNTNHKSKSSFSSNHARLNI